MVNLRRRHLIASLALAGCAGEPVATDSPGSAGGADAAGVPRPWRTVPGGFLGPRMPPTMLPGGLPGGLPPPATGMYVKFVAPGALALRGQELLVADLGTGRLWRVDAAMQALTGIAGAPVGPGTALLLGPDLSAWVLDPPMRQVLRFARDGRLIQTLRAGTAAAPSALALADGGNVLLQADGPLAQWSELRAAGVHAVPVRLEQDGRLVQVDALAAGRAGIWVLDCAAGRVHLAQRDGRIVQTLGEGVLRQPVAMAADRQDRVYVVEATLDTLHVLQPGAAPRSWRAPAELGVQQIGGIAVDEGLLALSDRLRGQVVIHTLPLGGA